MALIIKEIYKSALYLDTLKDERTQHFPLIGSHIYPVAILAAYFAFVLNVGPMLMRRQKAFNLKFVLIAYNCMQIYMSGWLVYKGVPIMYRFYDWRCAAPQFNIINSRTELEIYLFWVYFMVKISDLLDTVFFVLKKNDRQITFLHLYHHGGMVLLSWIGTKYIPTGHGGYLGLVNSFVHVIMYAYYLLTVIDPYYKQNLMLKKFITQLQLGQFMLLLVWFGQMLLRTECTYPKALIILLTVQNFFITALFMDFYYKTYIKRNSASSKTTTTH